MTNDECQMTKETRMTKDDQMALLGWVGFEIRFSSFFRHLAFVILLCPLVPNPIAFGNCFAGNAAVVLFIPADRIEDKLPVTGAVIF